MPASPMSFVLAQIYNEIPVEILTAAFDPAKNQTTLDERIIDEVIAVRVLMDLNLVSGLRTKIALNNNWLVPVSALPFELIVGSTFSADYYQIPSTARQNRNIVAIEQLTDDYTFVTPTNAMTGEIGSGIGNTISGLAQAAVSSRSLYNQPIMPEASLLSNNVVKVYPSTYSEGLIIECTLEFDRELTNMGQNLIIPVRELSVCAVKAYIYTKLRIKIDSSEIVAGMSIGAFKEIVLAYEGENVLYKEKLMIARGSTLLTSDHFSAFMRLAV